jgi:hypothetical protein
MGRKALALNKSNNSLCYTYECITVLHGQEPNDIDDSRISVYSHIVSFNILLAILLMYILKRNFNLDMQIAVHC